MLVTPPRLDDGVSKWVTSQARIEEVGEATYAKRANRNSNGLSRNSFRNPPLLSIPRVAEKSRPFRRMSPADGSGCCLDPVDEPRFGPCEVDWHRANTRACMWLGT